MQFIFVNYFFIKIYLIFIVKGFLENFCKIYFDII